MVTGAVVIDESAPLVRVRRAWRAGRLVVGATVLLALVALIVWRAGSATLLLPPSELRAQVSHGTWRHMFELHGLSAAVPLPLWGFAVLVAGWLGFPYLWLAAR